MLYAHASEEEPKQIAQAMKQTQNLSWYQRLHIIQLSSKGQSVTELSDLLGRGTATRRDYIKRYNKGGIEGLKRQVSSGAPPQIPFHSTEWEELLRQSPSQFTELETAARNWNPEFLVTYLPRYHGIQVTRKPSPLAGSAMDYAGIVADSKSPLPTRCTQSNETVLTY